MYKKIFSSFVILVMSTLSVLSGVVYPNPAYAVTACPLTINKPYKVAGKPSVYYITSNCTKKYFVDSKAYFSMFSSWKSVRRTTQNTLNKIAQDKQNAIEYNGARTSNVENQNQPGNNLNNSSDIQIDINMDGEKKEISKFIYGTNFQDFSWDGAEKNLTFARLGGNRFSTYNWENNASNAGSDWNQQSDSYLGGGDSPGEAVRKRIESAHKAGAAALITIPMQDHVAADKQGNGDVNQTRDYISNRFKKNLASKGSAFLSSPNTGDGVVYEDEFVSWLKTNFPYASNDSARKIFYSLDNEPDLWSQTHPRINPTPITYKELADKSIEYAKAIKIVDPVGLIFGPASYGFNGFQTLQNASDANGRNFLGFYLQSMKSAEQKNGKRLLDVLDIHWYPEAKGGGKRIIQDDSDKAIAQARIQAPRSLWDPSYKEDSWIANSVGPIRLIPWLKDKINANYPGTKLGITEYYYGGGNDISGAIAEADVLGIFGREGVFAANLWHMGNTDDKFIYGAMAMYRNFDGNNSTFGDQGLKANTSDIKQTSIYASIDSKDPRKMVVVLINKSDKDLRANLNIAGGQGFANAKIYQLTSQSASPVYRGDLNINDSSSFGYVMPKLSISTLLVTR